MALITHSDGSEKTEKQQQSFTGSSAGAPSGPGSYAAEEQFATESTSSLFRMLSRLESPSGLTDAAMEYVNNLEKLVAAKARGRKPSPLDVNITRLTSPLGVTVFEYQNWAIPVMLHDALNSPENEPDSVALQEIMNNYLARRSSTEPLSLMCSATVIPEDYAKVEVMACSIVNALAVVSGMDGTLNTQLLSGNQFILDSRMGSVQQFYAQNCPHGVPARNEFGLLLSVLPANQDRSKRRGGRNNYFNSYQTNPIPLGCITGYVEMVNSEQQGKMGPLFTPLIHISDIISPVMSLQTAILMICLFSEVTTRGRLYMRQFDQYNKNLPNLGSLISNESQTPPTLEFLESPARRDWFMTNFTTDPAVVLDVVDGRFRIPGLELFAMTDMNKVLLNEFSKLVDTPLALDQVANPLYTDYIGVVPDGTTLIDSRYIDYMKLMVNYAAESTKFGSLQHRYTTDDPHTRLQLLQQAAPIKVLYNCVTVELRPSLLGQVQQILRNNMTIVQGAMGGQVSIPLGQMVADWAAYSKGSVGFGAAPTVGTTSFTNNIYNWR